MPNSLQDQLQSDLATLRSDQRFRECQTFRGNSRVDINHETQELLSFSSNDYLGLACHPALAEAANNCATGLGFGASASRLVTGTAPIHIQLEERLADLVHLPAALLFPTGYQANLGLITSLVRKGDLVVADRSIHASLYDGIRLAGAKLAVYPHLHFEHAAKHLHRLGPNARRRFLVTESLFSMDGDFAPLRELAAIAKANDAFLIVDEAHAIGCLGPGGAGLCLAAGVRPDALIGTLGKAIGASGAFVAGTSVLRNYLINHARSFIFTTALPPPVAAASLAALDIISSPEGDRRRAALSNLTSHAHRRLRIDTNPAASPILPLICGSDQNALAASETLSRRGIFVQAIRPPTVRPGTSRLRLTLSAAHTLAHVERLGEALDEWSHATSKDLVLTTPSTHPTDRMSPAKQSAETTGLRGLVLIGTDTSVGKSTVALALLHLLAARGHTPIPFKPVETGADGTNNDSLRLLRASPVPLPLQVLCPHSFQLPVAPAAAAAAAGILLSTDKLLAAAKLAASYGSHLLVETAGGVLTPYSPDLTSAGLAREIALPILLVARNALGTINHTALALSELRRLSLPIIGYLLVDTHPATTPDRQTNATLIHQATGLAPLGTLPYLNDPTPSSLAAALAAHANLAPILAALT